MYSEEMQKYEQDDNLTSSQSEKKNHDTKHMNMLINKPNLIKTQQ